MLYLTYYEKSSGGEICAGQENDPWPDHETETIEFYWTGCFANKDAADWRRHEVSIDFQPVVGDKVWIVTVRYGTGNTFGHTDGAWELIGIYQNEEQAEKVRKSIEDDSYTGYKCWEGYFESYQDCEITNLVIE